MALNIKHLVLILSALLSIAILVVVIFFIHHHFWSSGMNDVKRQNATVQLQKQAKDFWEWRLKEDPELATATGVHVYDDKLEDQSLQAHDARFNRCKQFISDLSQASHYIENLILL